MKALNRFLIRARNAITSRHDDDRLREEMESHLASQAEENLRSGMAPAEALRQAHLKFGSVAVVQESYHAEKALPFFEVLLLDIRYALRVLRKSPSFTVVALITLMLGIGANVVVFGVLNAVLLHPLQVSDPQNLYQIRPQSWTSGRLLTTSYPAFQDIRRRNTTFSDMAAIYGYSHAALGWRNTMSHVSGSEVTGNYFDLLGVQPQLGRFFHATDERGPDSAPYVVLTNDLWRTTFQSNPAIVGTTVALNRHPFTVLGVAPAQFHGTEKFRWPDYWIPLVNERQLESGEDYLLSRTWPLTVIGRLRSGVTPQQATQNLNAISAELAREYPQTDKGLAMRLIRPGLFGDEADVIRGFLYSIAALAMLVLAAACANLASLFAARAADRSRELALRVALGASRHRLVRQLLTEAALVSLLGGAAGLASAWLLLGLLSHWRPSFGHVQIDVDARVYLAGLAFTLVSACLFGILPARQAWHSSPSQPMKAGAPDAINLRRFAMRDLLLGAQIAICTLLVTSSLVAVRGMVRALHAPLGVQPQGVTLAQVDFGEVGVDGDLALQKQKAMLQTVENIPAVSAAGIVDSTPISGGSKGIPIFRPEARELTLNNAVLETWEFAMSPGYLAAAGTQLLRGRDVSWQDTPASPRVAIVNETFARRMWGSTPAIGERFLLRGDLTEVIGVAQDGKYSDLTESPQAALYLPSSQAEPDAAVFVMRSRRPSAEIAPQLLHTLRNIEPDLPISVHSWPDELEGVLFPARAATVSLGIMGLLAAMLAVTGIFGMASYTVSRRMKELGIRVALGARKPQVLRAAIGRPIVLLGIGSLAGLLAGTLASQLLRRIVYQANPRDPIVLAGAVLTMTCIGIAAAAIPARRALSIDPSSLMRED